VLREAAVTPNTKLIGAREMADKLGPTFSTREFKIGSGWYVVVTWPGGQESQVSGFKTEDEALAWIENDAPNWASHQPEAK
jgi:hypothetical protein